MGASPPVKTVTRVYSENRCFSEADPIKKIEKKPVVR